MNTVSEIFKGLFDIAALLISLAVLAVLVENAGGTSQVLGSASSGFSDVLSTAMGHSSGFGGLSTSGVGGVLP